MSRTIRCNECKLYLGEIRDASLRKGLVYHCSECSDKINEVLQHLDNHNELFKSMFQGTWK